MSQRDAGTNLPLADCFSETPMEVKMFTHLWTIENFRFHPKDKSIKSPHFSAAPNDKVQWQLHLHPDGDVEENKGFLSIYLNMVSRGAGETSADYKISILNGNHESKAAKSIVDTHIFKLKDSGWGWGCFIERDEVLDSTNFPGDTIIVRTEIRYTSGVDTTAPSLTSLFPPGMPELNPSTDFRELLESRMFSDVAFDVNGREFRAHKAILATRSPTFKTLFERNPGSTQPTRLEIREADEHTFCELLRLVYTGETNESYPRIRNLLSAIAAQGQASSTTDGKNVKETKMPDGTNSQTTNRSLSSTSKDTMSADDSTASALSVLESISALISSTNPLESDPSTAGTAESHPRNGLTPSAALVAIGAIISATTLCSPRNETLTLELPKERSNQTTEIVDGALPMKREPILPSGSNEELQDDQLQGSSAAKQARQYTPVVGLRKFNGDMNAFFEWWREFRTQVHGRRDLCISEKLVNLLSVLESEAEECIYDSSLEVMKYYATLDALFLRYGNIEALPPGMFALLIVRGRSSLTLPLRVVDNRMLMEQIENIHRVSDASKSTKSNEVEHEGRQTDSDDPESTEAVRNSINMLSVTATHRDMISSKDPEDESVFSYSESGCQCQASSVNENIDDASMQRGISCSCVVSMEQQLEGLESLFAETRSPDSLARERLAKKINLTEATIQMWFRLRPVEWSTALHPHFWQLGEFDALRSCPIQTETIDSDGSDFDILDVNPLSASVSTSSV